MASFQQFIARAEREAFVTWWVAQVVVLSLRERARNVVANDVAEMHARAVDVGCALRDVAVDLAAYELANVRGHWHELKRHAAWVRFFYLMSRGK